MEAFGNWKTEGAQGHKPKNAGWLWVDGITTDTLGTYNTWIELSLQKIYCLCQEWCYLPSPFPLWGNSLGCLEAGLWRPESACICLHPVSLKEPTVCTKWMRHLLQKVPHSNIQTISVHYDPKLQCVFLGVSIAPGVLPDLPLEDLTAMSCKRVNQNTAAEKSNKLVACGLRPFFARVHISAKRRSSKGKESSNIPEPSTIYLCSLPCCIAIPPLPLDWQFSN